MSQETGPNTAQIERDGRPTKGRIKAVLGADAEGYGKATDNNFRLEIYVGDRWNSQVATVRVNETQDIPTAFHIKITPGSEARIDWQGNTAKFRVSWIPLALPCPTGARGSGPGPTTEAPANQP